MAAGAEHQVDLSTAIRLMSNPAEFELLASRIIAERPDMLPVLFGELHQRRADLHEAAGDAERAAADRWTAAIYFATMHARSGWEGYRIVDDVKAAQGDVLGNWRSAPTSVFVSIWNLVSTATLPPPLRSVLVLGLWELRSLWKGVESMPTPIDVARQAIGSHIEAAKWIGSSSVEPVARGMLVAQHWNTASRLASDIGQQQVIVPHIETLRAAEQQLLDEAPHWSLSTVEIEVSLAAVRGKRRSDLVADSRLEELLVLLDAIEFALQKMGHMDHVEPAVLDARSRIERLLGRGPDQQLAARRRAEMLARQASDASSGIVAAMKWKAAAAEYLQAGMRDEAATAKASARSSIQRADDQGEFEEVFVPLDVSEADIEKMVGPFFEAAGGPSMVLGRMATRLFVPSLERGRPAAHRSRSIVSQIAMTVPLVDDRTLAEIAPDTVEQARFEERRALLQEIALVSSVVISEILHRLRKNLHLQEDDLVAFLSASPYMEPDDLPFLRTAATRYLRDDRISAMHVLVPRVEQVVRRILKAAGTEVTALRDGELRERPLGELLRAAEADGTMPTELVRLLQAVLSEDWGMNLRNRVAHGLATEADCSQANLDRVLQLALLLSGIRLVDENGVDQGASTRAPKGPDAAP